MDKSDQVGDGDKMKELISFNNNTNVVFGIWKSKYLASLDVKYIYVELRNPSGCQFDPTVIAFKTSSG